MTDQTTNEFEAELEQTIARARRLTAEVLAALPSNGPCPQHPGIILARDDRQSFANRQLVLEPCPRCVAIQAAEREASRLQRMGVPRNLCGATFENWNPTGEHAEGNRAKARQFADVRRGFLLLLGDLGTGKTHLAVAILRGFKSGLFIKQSELLRRLRATYRDKAAVDPVDEAQDAACLVLDEVGLSPGGRDELPMLHDILDHRHGNQKPTIITGNVAFDELSQIIGERMADRLRESCFAILNFGGASYRPEARKRYFWQDAD